MTPTNRSQDRDADLTVPSPVQVDGEIAALRDGRAPYPTPVVQPLGHWQVHTLDQSVAIMRWS